MMACNDNRQRKLSPFVRECSRNKPNDMGRFIIELTGKEDEQVRAYIKQKNGKIKKDLASIPSIVVELPFSALSELTQSKQVKKIWADTEVKILS